MSDSKENIRKGMMAELSDLKKVSETKTKDESATVAAMVARRIGLERTRNRKGMSGCPLLDLCMEGHPALEGAILINLPVPPKSSDFELLMASQVSGGGPKSPLAVLEGILEEAKDKAGAWIPAARSVDVSLVFRTRNGAFAVYGSGAGLLSRARSPYVTLDVPGQPRGIPFRILTFLDCAVREG